MNNQLFTDQQLSTVVDFMIDQRLLDINTMIPCEIKKIKNNFTLDVAPLNKDVNANGTLENPPTIFNVPVMKIMGSNCLIDIELNVGDIGLVGFCHRDISSIVKQKKANRPPTKRMFSLSDGVWIGGLLKSENEIENSIIIRENNIDIKAKSKINITADSDIEIKSSADVQVDGVNVSVNGTTKAVIKGGGNNMGEVIEEIINYLMTAMMVPAAPGKPLDPAVSASLAPVLAKLATLK